MADRSVAGVFPGQGSQQIGMGRVFAEQNDSAKEVFEQADQALGLSISELCFEGPLEKLTLTEFSQPAILSASYACFMASGITLSSAAGHSLGEYTALVAAGVIPFQEAVQLVHKRGKYMQEAVPLGEGKMLAVMGPSEEELSEVISGLSGVCEIANLNCPGQTVVAGSASGVDEFSAAMADKGAKLIPLNVSAPFHCSLMQPAADKLAKDLDAVEFAEPSIPVYANFSAKAVSSGAEARELLKKQVCGTVRWTDSVLNLVAEQKVAGVVEFGPGGVLSKLIRRITRDVNRHEVHEPESLEKTKQALS